MAKRPAKKTAPKSKPTKSIREQVAAAHEAARVARRQGEPDRELVERARELERQEEAAARG